MAEGQDEDVKRLLQLYDAAGGQADGDAELQSLFDKITEAKQTMQHGSAPTEGHNADHDIVYPSPEFTVKSTTDSGRKVFINMCSSEQIAAPESWADGVMPDHVRSAVSSLNQQGELNADQTQALRIPLSLSEERSDYDKHGAPCTVFDCVFAVEVMREAAAMRAMKVFVIETVIGWINHKHKLGIDSKFKLPKLKYKGDTIAPHRIRKDPKKLVTEVSQLDSIDEEPTLALRAERTAPKQKMQALRPAQAASKQLCSKSSTPLADVAIGKENKQAATALAEASSDAMQKLTVQELQHEGKPCTHVHVAVRLPDAIAGSFDALSVQAAIDAVHIKHPNCAPLAVALNVFARQRSCRCVLKGCRLHISVEVLPVAELIELAEQSRPMPLGTIQLQSEMYANELD